MYLDSEQEGEIIVRDTLYGIIDSVLESRSINQPKEHDADSVS